MNKIKDILKRLKSPVVLVAIATLVYTHFLNHTVELAEYQKVIDVITFVVLGYGVFNNPSEKNKF